MDIPIINHNDFEKILKTPAGHGSSYKAMYSTQWEAIALDSRLMLIPIDDHLVHRGDGVFEAFRSHDGVIYDLDAHLDRLEVSANGIELKLPKSKQQIQEICLELGKVSQCLNATFRLYVSRGPGGFTTNPYESIGSQLYIVLTETKPYPDSLYQTGAKVGLSKFKSKEAPFCNIKNCNYLINVLMKKEAVDKNLDYTVSVDPNGFVTESSTENIALLTNDNEFLAPTFEYKLKGTTLIRCLELAELNKAELGLKNVGQKDLSPDDFSNAKEIMMIGTTMGVMPVCSFEGQEIQRSNNFDFAKKLRKLLSNDINNNSAKRNSYKS